MLKEYPLLVNGFNVSAAFDEQNVTDIFLPLLQKWTKLQKELDRRIFVFLVAPPGSGKTTLSLFLEQLSRSHSELTDIQAIGLDGFHYQRIYMQSSKVVINHKIHDMNSVKGSPETFDVLKLIQRLSEARTKNVLWPVYDRTIHDVKDGEIPVTEQIILLEGNYLLQNEALWRKVASYCDYSLFLQTDKALLKERLIDRKIHGGLSSADALAFYERTDAVNIDRVMNNHLPTDMTLKLKKDGSYQVVQNSEH